MQNSSLDYFKKLQFVCQKSRCWSSFKVKVNYICYFNWYISPIILTERKIQLVWQKFTKNSWLLPPSFHMFSKRSVVKISTEFNNSKSLLLLLLSRFSHVWLCATPQMAAHQASRSLGFSRQKHWSGLPFPSPMHESEKWKWSLSVVSNSSRAHGL